jgi:hypothetical protein
MIKLRVAAVMTTATSTETSNRQLSKTIAEHTTKSAPSLNTNVSWLSATYI